MVKKTTAIITVVALLAGCATRGVGRTATPREHPVAPTATPTLIPAHTKTFTPTNTPTITTTPTATATPLPTATPIPLAGFHTEVVGVGEHGAMVRLEYQGNPSDLEGLAMRVNIGQGGNVLDSRVPVQYMDGDLYAEMVDGKYQLGPVEVELNTSRDGFHHSAQLTTQMDRSHPFLRWLYGDSGLGNVNVPNPNHPKAYDLQPSSPQYPDGYEHPVFAPCDGIVYRAGRNPDTDVYNFYLYCEHTGYLVQMGHMVNLKGIDDSVVAGERVGYLDWDSISTWPHNHAKTLRPFEYPPCFRCDFEEPSLSEWVDMFNPHMQLGGEALQYGLWLPETLPQQVKALIDGGAFVPDYERPR